VKKNPRNNQKDCLNPILHLLIDSTLFKYAKRAEAAGAKLPKMLQGKTFQEYLESQGMEITSKRSGGTKIKTPHIMELPTVGKGK
jgi:hypothetical protein